MRIIRAPRFSGFCGGVKRAWSIAARTSANAGGPVYVSGELINNDPAMRELEGRGVHILRVAAGETPEQAGTLIMRAHGEGPQSFERARELGLNVVDATCGIVKVVQQKAVALEDQGYQVVLYGHRNHPESKATVAYTKRGMIIEDIDEARALPHFDKIAALAQTTALLSEYEKIVEVLKTKADLFENHGQVCAWTRMAQEEAEEVAAQCNVMIVVGGHKSANTHRLVEVCNEHCPSYLVETVDEVNPDWFSHDSVVGIAAGASTREQDVLDVIARIEAIGKEAGARTAVAVGGPSPEPEVEPERLMEELA
jgi:(E)-4-hydroxy-3-methyl-but-2-enyl pyrophosphate reductase